LECILAACGAAVLGAIPRRLDQLDLRTMRGEMLINGEVVQAGDQVAARSDEGLGEVKTMFG
jgi:2-keto-4-pentenoate hydratase